MNGHERPLFDEALQNMMDSLKDEHEMTEKRRRILEAAVELFAEKGFDGVSTSEIAQQAGVAEGTIFRHFKTKKDLLYALVAPLLIKFASPLIMKDVKKITERNDFPVETVIETLYRNRLELIEENWPRMKILIQEAQYHPEMMEAIAENLARQGRTIIETFIESRVEKGDLRPLPGKAVFRAIVSTMMGYLFFRRMFPDMLDENEEIPLMVDILLNGIKKDPLSRG